MVKAENMTGGEIWKIKCLYLLACTHIDLEYVLLSMLPIYAAIKCSLNKDSVSYTKKCIMLLSFNEMIGRV